MKTLETELRIHGRTLRQLKRQGRVAMYEVLNAGAVLIGYEVVIVQIRPEEIFSGRSYPEREVLPRDSEWGFFGWSFQARDLKGAQKRFAHLLPRWGASASGGPNKPLFDDGVLNWSFTP